MGLINYNIREHNIVHLREGVIDVNAPSFMRLLWRRVKLAWRMRVVSYTFHQHTRQFYKNCEPLKKIVFALISDNNRRSLEPIFSRLNSSDYSYLWPSQEQYVPSQLVYFYSLIYIWPLLVLYFTSSRKEKLFIRSSFDEFFETIGYVVVLDKLLKHSDVKLIVLANDHSSFPRALIKLAPKYGIKTMYMQHCSVTEAFPKLLIDYCFLDGEESYLKYLASGNPTGMVYLSGNPRFDVITKYRKHLRDRNKIGIASNALDNEAKVRDLCVQLQSLGYKDITIRPHPNLPFDPSWYIERGIEFSDSNTENPFAFLSRMRYVISGECGIHLDAVLMDVCAIYYNMTDREEQDVYSFIKNGITIKVNTFNEMDAVLKADTENRMSEVRKKAQWYNAAYNTDHEGHIGEMLADFIRYEQNGNIESFDIKYGFVENQLNNNIVKTYR